MPENCCLVDLLTLFFGGEGMEGRNYNIRILSGNFREYSRSYLSAKKEDQDFVFCLFLGILRFGGNIESPVL